ncbi:MAG: glycoside hydrolase family 16 protein, partial [Lentisphaerae bacterium]|nr:glycoside hydrolase family 16 protein [Lentisphaerota bacterium]
PYTYDGTPRTTEIDIFEGTLYARGSKVDYKSSTIHFYPGGWKDRSELPKVHNYLSFQRTRPAGFTAEDMQALLGDVILNRRDFRYDPANPRLIDNSADGQTRVVYLHGDDDRFLFDDGQYHTVALLWTPERYTFFYDHEAIGSLDQGISHTPQQLILSLRRMGGDMWLDETTGIVADPGRADPRRTPGRTLVDYVRVYKLPEDIAAIQAEAAAAAAPPSPAEALRKAIIQRLATAAVSLPEGTTGIGDAEITVDFDDAPEGWPQVVLPLQGTAPLACRGVSAEVTYLAEDGANLALSMAVPTWQKAGVEGTSRWFYLVPGQPTTCALAFETQTAPDGAVGLRLALKTPAQAHRVRLRELRLIPAE